MAEMLDRQKDSALVVLRSRKYFLLERRPNLPGVAYAGKISLFGGHLAPEDKGYPFAAAVRELGQELEGLRFSGLCRALLSVRLPHTDASGQTVWGNKHLYYAPIAKPRNVRMKVPGEPVLIPATPEGVAACQKELEDFTGLVLHTLANNPQLRPEELRPFATRLLSKIVLPTEESFLSAVA